MSTYDLGRQPFGLASPAAWLRRAGFAVTAVDVTREPLTTDALAGADLVAFHLPMHTATRLAIPLLGRVRREQPSAHLCCYGLYAPLNAVLLRSLGVATVLGAEYEGDLVALAEALRDDRQPAIRVSTAIPRLSFVTPDRTDLPPLSEYARLVEGADRRTVGYTEASRGCKHLCRHCPVVPVYGGRFRVVPVDVVMADIEAQVAAGATHVTFGDPDFFNGIGHAKAIIDAFRERWPGVTYDVTIKVEHLLAHESALARLRDSGCLFVTSAVESFDDRVLAKLLKGHTRRDVEHAVAACRRVGLTLSPTFVPFSPWADIDGLCDLLNAIEGLDLVEHVASIQFAIRLLITHGSHLLELDEIATLVEPYDPGSLTYPWRHPSPAVDAMHAEVTALVGRLEGVSRREVFDAVADLAFSRSGRARLRAPSGSRQRAEVPYLNEPWYC